jgi:hypothetical protein
MCHMFHTRTYKENNVTVLNIDREKVINPKPII